MKNVTDPTITRNMRQCIDACLECYQACLETARHCLDLGGKHAGPEHQAILNDCAEICQTSANFMLRGSDLHPAVCEVCAEVCRRCGEDCERLAAGDKMMLECAEICRNCAEACDEMASQQ